MVLPVALRRTTGSDPAYVELTQQLDAELWERYGEIQDAYAVYNDFIADTAVVASSGNKHVGCACFKRYDATTAELKRMYVVPGNRGRGIGRAVVREIEAWARELGYTTMVLETGLRQPEAVELYEASGYEMVDNFDPFVGLDTSVCFRKHLR
jgi:GNAT superfamily N-acetyltransferase